MLQQDVQELLLRHLGWLLLGQSLILSPLHRPGLPNASFDSIQSICEIFSPASDSASCTAGIGPSPIKFGATPFSPYDIILAMTGIEYFETECSLASTKAAAPSFIPDELPAVTVPSLSKAGFSLVKSSKFTAFL